MTIQQNYDSYYELSLTLLRKGGIIAIDNVLWRGLVVRINRLLIILVTFFINVDNVL